MTEHRSRLPRKLLRAVVIFGLLVMLTCIMIYLFSSQNSTDSSIMSGRVSGFITRLLFPELGSFPIAVQEEIKRAVSLRVRKCAHFTEYLLLAQFSFQLLSALPRPRKDIVCAGCALLFSSFFAVTDEFHQSFVPGRAMQARDVLIDTLGALLGIFIALRVKHILQKRDMKKQARR